MPTSSEYGTVEFFEDFLIDVIADAPEYSVDTTVVEIVSGAGGEGGVLRNTMTGAGSDVQGVAFGQLQWSAHDSWLELVARIKLDVLGTAAERVFVGLTDLQEATMSEFPFTGATTVTTAVANPDDAIGFFWEGDMTGAYWAPSSQNADAMAVHGSANMTAVQKTNATITPGSWHELKMRIDSGAKYCEFHVDGTLVYTYDSATAAVADVPLTPIFVVTEGTTAMLADIDYISVKMGRDA